MKLRLFVPLCLAFLLLASNSYSQKYAFGEMDIVTIVKQSGEVTSITIIAPIEFDGVSVQYTVNDTTATAVFRKSGKNANTSFAIKPLYRFLKGKSLYLNFDNQLPQLVIPMLYVDGITNVIGRGELITHSAKMSRMGVWSCRTSVRKEPGITKSFEAIPDEVKGKGTVIIIPIEKPETDNNAPVIQDYFETFLPGETTIRKTCRVKNNFLKGEFHGRAAQISHVMNQQGVKAMMETNLKPGLYRWFAADLSDIYVWAPAENIPESNPATEELLVYISNEMIRYNALYNSGLSVFPVALYSNTDTDGLLLQWKSVRYYIDENGETKPMHLPKMKVISFDEAVEEMIENIDIPLSLMGEYHCVDDNVLDAQFYQNLKLASLASNKLLVTEKISTVLSLLKGGFLSYPEKELEKAWSLILDNNTSVDGDLSESIRLSDSILDGSLKQIAPLISTQGMGKPVIVINTGTHTVSDMIAVPTNIPVHENISPSSGKMRPGKSINWRVFDVNNVEAPAQMVQRDNKQYLLFNAKEVAGTGIKTFYLKAADDKRQPFPNAKISAHESEFKIENQFYNITLSADGISSLYDLKHKTEVIGTGTSLAAVVIRDKKSDDLIYQSDQKNATWTMDANGPVMTEFKKREKTPVGDLITTLVIFHQVKKIAIDMDIQGGKGCEKCIIYSPIVADMSAPTIYYKVPLGFSKDGYSSVDEDIFLTPKQGRFSNVKNVNGIITIDNGDLEMAVSGDFLLCDISKEESGFMNVSPVSMVGENGGTIFNFRIATSFAGDKNLRINSYSYTKPLLAVDAPEKNMGLVPDQHSFFELRNRELEILSLRKAPGRQDVMMRILETQGKKSFAILDPMFAFKGFSSSDMNGNNPTTIPAGPAARLKLKTAIDPFSTTTILMHR